MRSLLTKLLLGLVGSLIVVMSFAPAAGAAPKPGPGGAGGSSGSTTAAQCAAPEDFTGSEIDAEAVADDAYLPLNRWGDGATGDLHSRLGGKFTDDTDQKIMRSFQGMMLGFGDSMWRVTGGLTEFATTFEILDQVGCTADRAAAGVGDAMLTGIAPLVVVAGIAVLLWRSAKGQEAPGKKVATMVLTLGAFAAMLAGAHATASSGTISAPSPAYLATTFNDTLTRVATAPTTALTSPNVEVYGKSGTVTDANTLHCRNYVAALRERYIETNGDGSSVPIAVSAMWEQSGLPAYVAVQYGSKNAYGQRMYCHILDRNAGVTSGKQFAIVKEANSLAAPSLNLPGSDEVDGDGGPVSELFSGGNNKTEDQAAIFWAACRWTGSEWAVYEGWGDDGVSDEGRQITPEKCSDVWSGWDAEGAGLDWTDSPSQIHDKTSASDSGAAVADYLLVWHGDAYAGSFATAAVYVVASFVVMCVFGMIALGVIVSKILGIVMIVMIFLMMTLALFPSQGDNNKLAKFIKFWLGMTVFSTTLALILSLVALITGFVNAAGLEAFGQGSFLSILWLGFAPVTAVVLLHMVAKHAIGMPSPFKPSGALAWGAAAGATGAGLGVGLDRMARRGRGYGQSMVQGKVMRGRNKKGGDTRAAGRDQQMPTGGRGGDTPAPDTSETPEMPETTETTETPDTRSRRERASDAVRGVPRNAAAGARDIGASMNAWRRRIPTDAKNWAKNKPIRRVVVPAAVLAAAGVGGAASVLAAPAAPIVVGAIGARALWRRRQGAAGVVTGKRQADDGTWETRDDQRRRRETEYERQRQGEEPLVSNGEEPVVVRPAEGDGHSHPGGYL